MSNPVQSETIRYNPEQSKQKINKTDQEKQPLIKSV